MSDRDKFTAEFLLRKVLKWYANQNNWIISNKRRGSLAKRDSGRIAKIALKAKCTGGLLPVICDIASISMSDLGRRSKISPVRIAEITRGDTPTFEEAQSLYSTINSLIP